MSSTQDLKQAQQLAAQGMSALGAGDGAAAKAALERAIQLGWPGAPVWVALSRACQMMGDGAGRAAALERALIAAPRDPRALLARGELFEEAGETEPAAQMYEAALAALGGQQAPEQIAALVEHARAFLSKRPNRLSQQLRDKLSVHRLDETGEDALFAQSLDILTGEKQVFVQRPTRYYYPGLPNIQFYDPSQFDWAASVESKTPLIRAELDALLADRSGFAPYVESAGREEGVRVHDLQDNPEWSAFYLVKQGKPVDANIARCPATHAAIQALGEDGAPAPAHSVLFSLLKPGAAIPPHTGMINTRLVCHLPLIIPENCGFRVGNDVREWSEGKLFVFDDTIEHEAWNRSDQERFVLIFEIWRPELSERQRVLVSDLMRQLGG